MGKGERALKNNDFIKMVDEDILKCDVVITTRQGIMDLLTELMGKYSKVSNNFPDIEMNSLLFRMHPNVPMENIRTIQGFLKAYRLNNCEDYKFDELKSTGINVITNISNSNENTINLQTFSEVRNKIENMGSLSDPEIEEILSKVDELEEIVNSSDRKTKKWDKAKEIIKWVADKGVDVAMTLIPLLMKIGTAS